MSDSDDDVVPVVNAAARYEELLRPCRDLAANWNVDVVAKLSEYLAELDIVVNPSAAETCASAQINFQHAALVVEGGTCVYSRKVDYLYGLVFAAADMIYEARGKVLPSSKANAQSSPGEDDADGTPVSDEVTFLLLDDELEANQPDRDGISLARRSLSDDRELHRARDENRLVSVPLHLLPPGPQNARRASAANQNNVGLRMPGATVNVATGALVLDGIGIEPNLDGSPSFGGLGVRTDPRVAASECDFDDDGPMNDFGGDCGDDSGVEAGGDLVTLAGESDESVSGVQASGAQPGTRAAGHAPARKSSAPLRRAQPLRAATDPYKPLDPHDTMSVAERPVQRGKTWSKPAQRVAGVKLDPKTTAEAAAPLALVDRILGPAAATYANKTNRFVSFPAAQDHFKARMRSISVAKRRRTQLRGGDAGDPFGDLDGTVSDDLELLPPDGGSPADDLAAESDDDPLGGSGPGGGNDGDDDDGEAPDFDALEASDVGQLPNDLAAGGDAAADRQVEKIAASYEEACRKYLVESSILWQEHAADTQLEQRVAEWRSRIEPLLCVEEERHAFDIKQYGSSILDRFRAKLEETESRESDMCALFDASEPFEVCRNFLAALQLVNSYKIDIVRGDADATSEFNPRVTLLMFDGEGEGEGEGEGRLGDVSAAARTPTKGRARTPLRERSQPLGSVATPQTSPAPKTPRRRGPAKRNRQAGSTPASARRAPSKARVALHQGVP